MLHILLFICNNIFGGCGVEWCDENSPVKRTKFIIFKYCNTLFLATFYLKHGWAKRVKGFLLHSWMISIQTIYSYSFRLKLLNKLEI